MSKSNQSKVTNDNPFLTDTSGAETLLNAVATKKTIEEIKGLHQYYRDCLVNNFEFPPLGSITPELVKSVIDSSNTDISGLADHLHGLSNEAIPSEQDRALRLMLMTILQANLVADRNNRFVDYTPHPDFLRNIKNAINRVLQLHNNDGFLMISVQLLYRINAIEAVLALSDTIPEIFQKYANLQAIIGFIHTALGNYETAMRHLSPLVAHSTHRDLPLVGLSYMTCQYFLGQNPSWPLTFKSLQWGIDTLPRQIKNLPPLEIIQPLPDSLECPIIFVACDEAYFFEHALYLAYSIHETNAEKVALHLHLFSPKASVLAEIDLLRERLPGLQIGVSVEYLDALKCHPNIYYSTVRFVRAYQLLLHYDKEMCMMDADSLVNQSWDSFATLLDSQTEIILAAPKMSPFWERIIAGFLYFKATPKGKFFMAKVSQFILQNIEENKAIWFTDQIALSVCNDSFVKNDSSVKHIDNKFLMDIHHGQQAFSWAITTIKTGPSPYESARVRLRQKYNLPLADLPLLKNKFTEVYEKNLFGGKVSRSGEGSNLIQTEIIRFEIPKLLQELNH